MLAKSLNNELRRRRRAIMRQMGEHSIALIPAAREKVRSRDTLYKYRQDSNFFYLSGFDEPDSLLVLVPGRKAGEYLLFCREKDKAQEIWDGRRLGVDAAPDALGADDAFPIGDVDDILPGLLEGRRHVYHTLGKDQVFDTQLLGWLQKSRSTRRHDDDPDAFISIDYLLHDMRVYKSRSELARLRRAAKTTAAGLTAAMQHCQPGMYEYELEAELIAEYRRQGCDHAFLPIVGGGANGCILHYGENQDVLSEGDLVLVDTGAEYQGYAGDITRTFPVSGEFSAAQKEVYSIVLEAQLAAIDQVKQGNHWRDPHDAAVRVITKGLKEIGILKGSLNTLIKKEAHKPYYMHGTGHWLGQDVHDVGETKIDGQWRMLEAGMVLTFEPGLYLNDQRGIPKRFRNIGIRIEDDVVVEKKGCDILSADVPKAIDDIESLMAQ